MYGRNEMREEKELRKEKFDERMHKASGERGHLKLFFVFSFFFYVDCFDLTSDCDNNFFYSF
jgi:hypothetical protein